MNCSVCHTIHEVVVINHGTDGTPTWALCIDCLIRKLVQAHDDIKLADEQRDTVRNLLITITTQNGGLEKHVVVDGEGHIVVRLKEFKDVLGAAYVCTQCGLHRSHMPGGPCEECVPFS